MHKYSRMQLSAELSGWLRSHLRPTYYRRIVRMAKAAMAWRHRNDLSYLAGLFGTDKWGAHWFTPHYQRYFAPLRHRRLNIMEIGVGGYEDMGGGAASLRMWKAYFRKSRLVGIDLYDKSHLSESRIEIRQCDQTNAQALLHLVKEYGGFDIVIDDGSHLNDDVVNTFKILFPTLRPNGIYAVEDTQTAYWQTWGGGIENPQSSISFFKRLVDGLNHSEYPIANYTPTYLDRHIVEIVFFHNLVLIRKGQNDETTNMPSLIERELAAAGDAAARKNCARVS